MSEDWAAVAAEVTAGLKELSSDGEGYPVLLQRPGAFSGGFDAERADPSYHQLISLVRDVNITDGPGGAVKATQRRVMVNATGFTPMKQDRIAVGLSLGDQDKNTKWDTIAAVKTVVPAGVPLYHILTLEG